MENNFDKYINKIKTESIKNNLIKAINDLPEYFYNISASSTNKYHPKFSLGEGGLFRHTTFACDIALELFNIIPFSQFQKDVILSALILHDGRKMGNTQIKHTLKNHDDFQADYLQKFWEEDFEGKNIIIECIRTHAGQWSTTKKPKTKLEKFVHTCDYLASRKIIDKYI